MTDLEALRLSTARLAASLEELYEKGSLERRALKQIRNGLAILLAGGAVVERDAFEDATREALATKASNALSN